MQILLQLPQRGLCPKRKQKLVRSISPAIQPRAVQASAETKPVAKSGPGAAFLGDARTSSFYQFCVEKLQVAAPKLRVAEFGGVRGMGASAEIKEDEIMMSIPRSNAIRLSPKQSAPPGIAPEYWGKAPWFVKMALLLLHEKSQGTASRLGPYLEQLPQSFDAPVNWEESQLQALQYPHLIHAVKEQQAEWSGLYADLQAQGLQPGRAPITKKEFVWALCAVRSRTFSGPYIASSMSDRVRLGALVGALVVVNSLTGLADAERTASAAIAVFIFNILYEVILSQSTKQYAMCPLIDFINHSSKYKNEVTLDYFSDRYSVTAGRSYAKGEQVFISYGANQTNDSLMQYYGFTEQDNPDDCYVMTNMLKWLDDGVAPGQARLDALNSAGLLKSLQLVTVVRTGFPADTLQALRFVLASPEDASRGVSAFANPGNDVAEARLAALLVHACTRELSALGTSLEEDEASLAAPTNKKGGAKPLSAHERLAITFRIEKKKVLRAALGALGGN